MSRWFRKPTPAELADQHLRDAELQLLHAEATLESWQAERDKLIKRVERLKCLTAGNESGK